MSFDYWIDSITFSDGSTIAIQKGEVVIIVGPNNAGKSRSLRDIQEAVYGPEVKRAVVKNIGQHREGTSDELKSFLTEHFAFNFEGSAIQASNFVGYNVHGFAFGWGNSHPNAVGHFLINRLDIEQRLAAANPAPQIDPLKTMAGHPLQVLYGDDDLLAKLNDWFWQAFKQEITIDLRAGATIPLYAGTIPKLQSEELPTSTSYLNRLRSEAVPLHQQGDGMRAFVGVLLNTLLLDFKVQLIDEPEAFLHPPQAQLLGNILCRNAKADSQLFISTHSGDFIKGALKSGRAPLRIIRIRREGNVNHARTLSPELIYELWSNPVLLQSNVLDGVFHDKVVICESDADCRFYNAVADALRSKPNHSFLTDVMFVQSGGKHAISKLAAALRQLDVPIAAVADIDILREEQPLRAIIESLGGQWSTYEQKWKIVHGAIAKLPPLKESHEILGVLEAEVSHAKSLIASAEKVGAASRLFPKTIAKKIENVLRDRTPGALLKKSGRAALPQGQETAAFDALVAALREIGLFVLEVGELERFVQTVGGHGSSWLSEVLTHYGDKLDTAPQLEEARKFVIELVQAA